MNIYLIRRGNGTHPFYDANWGHVVQAESPNETRRIAALAAADEGGNAWYLASTTVKKVGESNAKKQSIILTDYMAG